MEACEPSLFSEDDPKPLDRHQLRVRLKLARDLVSGEMADLWNLLGWAEVARDTAEYERIRAAIASHYWQVKQIRDDFLSNIPDEAITSDDLSMIDILCEELHTCEILKNKLKL